MHLKDFQRHIHDTFGHHDGKRGLQGNFLWFIEEVGELAEELRLPKKSKKRLEEEFADVIAWLMSLATLSGVDMERAIRKYRHGCPKCRRSPCACVHGLPCTQ